MTKRFLRISTAHTLRETLAIILYGEKRGYNASAIVIINQEGDFAGIATPSQVALGLLGDGQIDSDTSGANSVYRQLESRQENTVDCILSPYQPAVDGEATLARLVKLAGEAEYECIPVLEGGRVEGLVYAVDIFQAAALVALNPEDEGIAIGDGE